MIHPAATAAALLYSTALSQAALVGFWDFEEGSGTTTADQSGGAHTGTLGVGATWSTAEFAPVPSGSTASIAFDGTDLAHVLMNGYKADEVGGTNSRTLAAWIKSAPGVTVANSNLGIFGYGANVAGDKWNFRTQNQNGPMDGNIRVEVNGGYIVGSTVVIDNMWHHVAMTWEDDGSPDITDALLYVDGVLETISISLTEEIHTDTVNGIDLAISDDHSQREWNGWLDDIRIYDEVLGANEIATLAGAVPEPSSGLLGLLGLGALFLKRRR
jgi:MYXO-CTERM domain-containing protein